MKLFQKSSYKVIAFAHFKFLPISRSIFDTLKMRVQVSQVGVLSINFWNIRLADGAISLTENNAIVLANCKLPSLCLQTFANSIFYNL